MKKYKINEIFHSIQGEGAKSGTACVFIRFSGCNLKCPFCDTKHEDGVMMSADEIVEEVRKYPVNWVVLTGGEPTLFADKELADKLHQHGLFLAIETNGTHELLFDAEWITLSPKDQFVKNAHIKLHYADEIKVVFTGDNNVLQYDSMYAKNRFVQPCDTGDADKNASILAQCINFVKEHPSWRISLQTQKILNVR